MIWMLWMLTSSGVGSSTYTIFWRNRLELHLTLKLDFNLAVNELISLQNFTKSSPFVMSICFPRFAVRQAVVVVGFLGVIVRSHFVHPKHDWIPYCILHRKKNPYFAERRSKIRFFTHKKERKKERLTSSDNVRHEEFLQSINASVVALNWEGFKQRRSPISSFFFFQQQVEQEQEETNRRALLCFASPYGHTQLHCTDGVRRASRLSITTAPSASASDSAAALSRDFTGAAPSCSCSCFLFVFLFLGLFFL